MALVLAFSVLVFLVSLSFFQTVKNRAKLSLTLVLELSIHLLFSQLALILFELAMTLVQCHFVNMMFCQLNIFADHDFDAKPFCQPNNLPTTIFLF